VADHVEIIFAARDDAAVELGETDRFTSKFGSISTVPSGSTMQNAG